MTNFSQFFSASEYVVCTYDVILSLAAKTQIKGAIGTDRRAMTAYVFFA
jgi:hypothetical protein